VLTIFLNTVITNFCSIICEKCHGSLCDYQLQSSKHDHPARVLDILSCNNLKILKMFIYNYDLNVLQ
jgi:hypothetical protein